MNDKFWNIPTQGWKHKVCSGSFLNSMFMDDNDYPHYKPLTPELLRYIRNVHVHYKENLYPNLHYDYSDKGQYYTLDSNLHGKHIVYIHNPKEFTVLTHKKYQITLKQWLEQEGNKDNLCPIYRRWKIYRPKEEAR